MTRRSRSKRSVENRLAALESNNKEYPEADLATILSAEFAGECGDVDGRPGLIRCHGEVYQVPQVNLDVLGDTDTGERPDP